MLFRFGTALVTARRLSWLLAVSALVLLGLGAGREMSFSRAAVGIDSRYSHSGGSLDRQGKDSDESAKNTGFHDRNWISEWVPHEGESPGLKADLIADPIPSPGIKIGVTTWELQQEHSQGRQVSKSWGGDLVHFAWTRSQWIPPSSEEADNCLAYLFYLISWNMFNDPGLPGPCGGLGWLSLPGGRCEVSTGRADAVHIMLDTRSATSERYSAWHRHFPWGPNLPYALEELSGGPLPQHAIAPRIDIQSTVSVKNVLLDDVYHVIAHGSEHAFGMGELAYWRFDGSVWSGPVVIDSSATHGHVLAANSLSDEVAIGMHVQSAEGGPDSLRNIAIYKSLTRGQGWLDGSELGSSSRQLLTHYADSSGPEAWVHISMAYDRSNLLHVIWDERRWAGVGSQAVVRHWNNRRGTVRPVSYGYWDNSAMNGGADLNLAKMTIGIGDGSTLCSGAAGTEPNSDFLYVLYTQFGGTTPEEQGDSSLAGFMNGELYLTVSPNAGDNWSVPRNLTNTKSPDCQPVELNVGCASEHWSSIAKVVEDIHILYIRDYDAGAAPLGEGTWSGNYAVYLRLPGGTPDAEGLCPNSVVSCACLCNADPECDGVVNVLDVVAAVGVAFRSGPQLPDPHDLCPVAPTDVNCDGLTNVLDVVRFVNVAFRSADPQTEFCDPCGLIGN